jgi:hypothetical protein
LWQEDTPINEVRLQHLRRLSALSIALDSHRLGDTPHVSPTRIPHGASATLADGVLVRPDWPLAHKLLDAGATVLATHFVVRVSSDQYLTILGMRNAMSAHQQASSCV